MDLFVGLMTANVASGTALQWDNKRRRGEIPAITLGDDKMKCPHCGKEIDRSLFASEIGKIKSKRKSKSSAENGKKGGRPKKKK